MAAGRQGAKKKMIASCFLAMHNCVILTLLTGLVATIPLYWSSNLHMHLRGKSEAWELEADLFQLTHFL
jgi:hypothetical protein